MLDHRILTWEEESTYGQQMAAARELRGGGDILLEERMVTWEMRQIEVMEEEEEERWGKDDEYHNKYCNDNGDYNLD
jgi:hypothetical protein